MGVKSKSAFLGIAFLFIGSAYGQTNFQEAIDKLNQQSNERCANPEFKAFYDKTPCTTRDINFQYVSDATKITPTQKKVLLLAKSSIDAIQKERMRIEREAGMHEIVHLKEQLLIPQNDANNLDLYNGKITWGEYNTKRRDIFNNYLSEVKKLNNR